MLMPTLIWSTPFTKNYTKMSFFTSQAVFIEPVPGWQRCSDCQCTWSRQLQCTSDTCQIFHSASNLATRHRFHDCCCCCWRSLMRRRQRTGRVGRPWLHRQNLAEICLEIRCEREGRRCRCSGWRPSPTESFPGWDLEFIIWHNI